LLVLVVDKGILSNEPTTRIITPMSTTESSAMKQGAAIGGWLCFVLGGVVMYFSLWTFILYVPLFLVAFVLSIVAMAQRRILAGIILLLATLILPPGEWFGLVYVRGLKKLDADLNPRTVPTLASAQPAPVETPADTSTPTSQPAQTDPTPSASPSTADAAAAEAKAQAEMREAVDKIEQVSLKDAHAWQMEFAMNKVISTNGAETPEPAFTPDCEAVLLPGQSGDLVLIGLRDHKILENWTPAATPTCMVWSKDGKRLAYKCRVLSNGSWHSQLHIVDWDTKKDTPIQPSGSFGSGDGLSRMSWMGADKLVCVDFQDNAIYSLDLTTSQVEVSPLADNEEGRKQQWKAIFATPMDHPYCEVLFPNGRGSNSIFVREKDQSYARSLGTSPHQLFCLFVSPDLRHVLVLGNGVLTHCIIGVRQAPVMNFKVAMDNSQTEFTTGKVYAPMVDFLTHKVLGPNLKEEHGLVKISTRHDTFAKVTTTVEEKAINVGDVAVFENVNGNSNGDFWRQLQPLAESDEISSPQATPSEAVKATETSAPPPPMQVTPPVAQPVEAQPAQSPQSTRLTASDIAGFTLDQVQRSIDGIYARYGVEFARRDAQAWADSQPWYHRIPGRTPDDAEKLFTDDEKSNIELLAARRDALKTGVSGSVGTSDPESDAIKKTIDTDLRAMGSGDTKTLLTIYGDTVDYYDNGVVGRDVVESESNKYFARWPVLRWALTSKINVEKLNATDRKLTFTMSFDASNSALGKTSRGNASETWIVRFDASGDCKIISQKEAITKRFK
jgi:cell division septation protein DedD